DESEVERRRARLRRAHESKAVGEGGEGTASPDEHVGAIVRPLVADRALGVAQLESVARAMPAAAELTVGDYGAHHRIPHREPHAKAMAVGQVEAQAARGRVDANVFSARDAARERAESRKEAQRARELAAPRASP